MNLFRKHKKGQLGILSLIFMFFVFIVFWAAVGGSLLKDYGEQAIAEHGYTGFTAFVLGNMNVFIFIGLILAIIVSIGFASR
jgi:hypothetical protein